MRGLGELSKVVNRLESQLLSVTEVRIPEQHLSAGDELTAVISTELRTDTVSRGVELRCQNATERDSDELEFTVTIDVEALTEPIEENGAAGSVSVSPDAAEGSQSTEGGPASENRDANESIIDDAAVTYEVNNWRSTVGPDSRENRPAYKDPEQLRAVYEEYDTFEKMKEALGVDVSFQTVRRHMIKHGIHEVQHRESAAESTAH